MVERLTRAEDREGNGDIGRWQDAIRQAYADFQVIDSVPVCRMSVGDDAREEDSMLLRQSCIDCGDAELETPEDSSVKRPSYDLNLGTPDSVIVFFGAVVDTCTLVGCHVAVGKAIEIGANKVCRCHFCCEKELFNGSNSLASIDFRTRNDLDGWQDRIPYTYSGQWHQVIVQLPISWSYGPPSEEDSNKDGKQPNRE